MINTYDFEIADLLLRVESPFKLQCLYELSPFRVPQVRDRAPDALYSLALLPKNWVIRGTKLAQDDHSAVYEWNGELHRYYYWNIYSQDRFVLLTRPRNLDGANTIYLQEDTLERILPQFRLSAFLAPERLLLANQAFLLHAAVVEWQGRGILFTAPSGTGKSTQARLWAQLEGAEVINGDRAIIRHTDGGYMVYGSPYAGTSGIYRSRAVPLDAIVVLSQAPRNALQQLTPATAFRRLLPQATALPWDGDFMNSLTELILRLVSQVKVFHLACLPNADAVAMLKDELTTEC